MSKLLNFTELADELLRLVQIQVASIPCLSIADWSVDGAKRGYVVNRVSGAGQERQPVVFSQQVHESIYPSSSDLCEGLEEFSKHHLLDLSKKLARRLLMTVRAPEERLLFADLPIPGGVDAAGGSNNGRLALRIVRFYDSSLDRLETRVDMLFGFELTSEPTALGTAVSVSRTASSHYHSLLGLASELNAEQELVQARLEVARGQHMEALRRLAEEMDKHPLLVEIPRTPQASPQTT